MEKAISLIALLFVVIKLQAQEESKKNYWQVKVDFLEPLVNKTLVARVDFGMNRHLFGVVGGVGGNISQYDNKQFETYQDKINYRIGLEYQFFLSKNKQNKGFYAGADCEYGSRTIESKVSNESLKDISVVTPGLWIGYLWRPFKKANFLIDLTIIHPRYTFGSIKKTEFQTVSNPYEPKNLFNFLGPWSVGWRF